MQQYSLSRRRFGITAGAAVVASASGSSVFAQAFPGKPVRFVIAQGAGSSADGVARYLGSKLSPIWGQQVVVENKPGANGIVGLQYLATQPADGHAFALAAPSTMTINQFVYKKMPVKPLDDFMAVTQLTTVPFALVVNPNFPPKNVRELVALAKQKEGALNYSSPGVGNLSHLAAELLSTKAGIKMQHVPNKGDAAALLDVMSGQTQFMFITLPGAMTHVRSGKLRLMAVLGTQRLPIYPDVPTVAESGFPEVVVEGWSGVIAPAGTPAPVVDKIQKDFAKILGEQEVRDYLAGQGQNAIGSTPDAFKTFMRNEADKWSKVVSAIGLQIDE